MGGWLWSPDFSLAQESALDHFYKGEKLNREGDYQGAAAEFEKALELEEDNSQYQEWAGYVLVEKLEKYPKAIELLEGKPNLHQSAKALYYLGKAFFKRGDSAQAESHLQKALSLTGEFEPDQKLQEKIKVLLEEVNEAQAKISDAEKKDVPEEKPVSPDTKTEGTGRDDTFSHLLKPLLQLALIFVLALGVVIALRYFVWPQTSKLRDIALFLVLILVIVFTALFLKLISPDQFTQLIKDLIAGGTN